MKLKDMSNGYYSTSTTLQNLERIADATNEASLMQQPVKIQGGTVTPLGSNKVTGVGIISYLKDKLISIFKRK